MLSKRLCAGLAVAGLAAIGVAAAPTPAEAWWRGGWCCGFGVGFVLPPIVVAPPVYAPPPPPAYYPPPPAYYAPPAAYYPAATATGVDTGALAGDDMDTRPLGVRRGA
jgi:hypothetical protein